MSNFGKDIVDDKVLCPLYILNWAIFLSNRIHLECTGQKRTGSFSYLRNVCLLQRRLKTVFWRANTALRYTFDECYLYVISVWIFNLTGILCGALLQERFSHVNHLISVLKFDACGEHTKRAIKFSRHPVG